jgi:hypothetical protein
MKETFTHRSHEVILTSWVSSWDGCLLSNYTIDGVSYPYPHRSKEAAIEKARYLIDRDYWVKVRNAVENSARRWSCGTEGRLLFENLCEHQDWQERLMDLAPDLEIEHPSDMAAVIVSRYFSRVIAQESQRDMENDERRWARITDPEPISGSEFI